MLQPRVFCFVLLCCLQFAYGQEVSYVHKDVTYDQVKMEDIAWLTYQETLYNGFDNGVYWFRIKLPPSKEATIIHFPESHLTRGALFANNSEIQPLSGSRYIAFSVPASSQKTVYYVKINCFLDATIPLTIQKQNQYRETVQYEFLKIGVYYGIVLSILLINLFSYFSFRNNTYLHYLFMVIGMSLNAFYKDGLLNLIMGFGGINEYLEPIINSILMVSAAFFTASYLGGKKRNPKLHLAGVVCIGISLLITVVFCVTSSFLFFALSAICTLIAIDVFWSLGLVQWKHSFKAKLFTIAYGIPLLFAHAYYIGPHFGFRFLQLPLDFYKVGSVFEMVFFTYAIMFETKKIAEENKIARIKLMEYASQVNVLNTRENKKQLSVEELKNVYGLTTKEIAVLQEVALVKTNKEIADLHFISVNTVKYHIRNILNKFEVKSKKEAREKYLVAEKITQQHKEA